MLSLKIKSPTSQLDLSELSSMYRVTNIEGIDFADMDIFSDKVSMAYGSIYRGRSIIDREISITIRLIGDIQTARRNINSFFGTQEEFCIELIDGVYSNAAHIPLGKTAFINGYIKSVDYQIFSKSESVKMSFYCPYPYFTRPSEGTMTLQTFLSSSSYLNLPSSVLKDPYFFNMSIAERRCNRDGSLGEWNARINSGASLYHNIGDVETGFIWAYKLPRDGWIQVGGLRVNNLLQDSIVIIDTRPTNKSVMLINHNIMTRITNKIAAGSRWSLCSRGTNTINISVPARIDYYEYWGFSFSPEYKGI